MFRLSTLSLCAAAMLAVAVLVSLPNPALPQGKGAAAAQKKATSTQNLLRLLDDERMATKDFDGPGITNLKQCLTIVYERYKFPILVDLESFKAENPDMPDMFETIVEFPSAPQTMTLAEILRHVLSKVGSKNATFVVMRDHLLITTYERTTATSKLNEKVRGVFENQPLSSVLRELSERVGATIVIDSRALDKAKTEISATFLNDIPLAGALRVLTEMAELKVIVLDGAILVTTPAHAEALRKEQKAKSPEGAPVVPAAPSGGGLSGFAGGLGLPGVLGQFGAGLPGFPGVPGSFAPDDRIVDPLWPFDPKFAPWSQRIAK